MTLVLDTSILIDIERRKQSTINILKELSQSHSDPAKITFINQFEFLLGLKEKSPKNKNTAKIFLNEFLSLQTTQFTAEVIAELKQKYDSIGITIPLADLLIATITLEKNCTLVTKDKDFEKIKELRKIIIS